MNDSTWKLGNKLGVSGGLLAAVIGEAQAALPLAPVYAPGPMAVEAGSFGGAAAVVWAPVLLLTLLCGVALALLLREPRIAQAVQAPVEPVAQPVVAARSRRLPKRPVRRAARVVVLSEPLRRAPRAVRV